MALLGVQLVVTLVMVSVIQKLGPHFSLARFILCSTGLVRYLYPTDSELRQLANIPKDKLKKKNNKILQNNGRSIAGDVFKVPRSLDIKLETAKVSHLDVVHLRYYTEYLWLVDFSVYAALVYVITEIYHTWFTPKEEVNLSMIWCSLVIIFAFKVLCQLTIQYFKGEESIGERSTCIVMGFMYLLVSMMVLIIDENTLELGLESAYVSFNHTASEFLAQQGLSSTGPASKIVLKFFIAVWCGILGALFTFPGLRIARMHWDLLQSWRENKFKQLLLNMSFAMPFLLVILWIKPISRDYLTVRIFSGRTEPLMSTEAFESMRLIAVVVTMLLKALLMPWYLQAYLDMAYHRIEQQKKEAGKITNNELQKKIAAVFYYLCVVTLQYLAPVLVCLFLNFMYKTLGEYNWTWWNPEDSLQQDAVGGECPVPKPEETQSAPDDPFFMDQQQASDFHLTLDSLKKVLTSNVYRGLFGFSTWWCCFLYFATTSIGLVYQSYFSAT
ncbi:unnamed protein product [Acanthoscelides obtectus]|uniref:Transmembrane protein 161B n=1 Tax=Acanthoscelides obtectus TaxID=200917 RepID=A0A9P0KXG7_ACAOB|nr:unnamed protein product [Acanthoscelides obtectus]CAK1647690.1 Transmembrane protein 161B [Acanthoscelides obtectus]